MAAAASPDHDLDARSGVGVGGGLVSWTLKSVLILVAVVLFVVAAIGVNTGFNLLAIGLACFAGAFIVPDRGVGRM
jgi:hypothetical protein